MPSDDYTSFKGAGALKLKGGKVSKPKKKKKDKERSSDLERALSTGDAPSGNELEKPTSKKPTKDDDGRPEGEPVEEEDEPIEYKTEAQKRHEEYKRKKERVEELNTYLSKLSEHHDMPKIGPG
ncbi:hypothetical protein SCUP234_12726 [Seiridium cupressi]